MNATAVRAGFLTSVQDLGRPGFREFGVSLGGALDPHALQVANLLAGNEESAAGLEITFGGLRLRFADDRIVVWGGGSFDARIGSTSSPAGHPTLARAREEFSIVSPSGGCRAWLAISGGIDVPAVLGSRSGDLRAGFGGLKGRPVRDGEEFSLGQNSQRAKVLIEKLRTEKIARWKPPHDWSSTARRAPRTSPRARPRPSSSPRSRRPPAGGAASSVCGFSCGCRRARIRAAVPGGCFLAREASVAVGHGRTP